MVSTSASPQTLEIAIRSRAVQQGDLLVVTVTHPATTGRVNISGFGRDWPTYSTSDVSSEAIVGIDLDQRPGSYRIEATTEEPLLRVGRSIQVLRRKFPTRVLTVQPQYVNPPAAELERINREASLLSDLYAHSDGQPLFVDGFQRPVPGRANSSFGSRSVFNGQPRSPHAGTDFLSGSGTPILAPAAGRVVVAGDLYFTGNTVVIDHGLGVVSLLAHMSRVDVHEGQMVHGGDVVGLVGATGRVTGPHLHWALRVGGARVDPLSALAVLPTPPEEPRAAAAGK